MALLQHGARRSLVLASSHASALSYAPRAVTSRLTGGGGGGGSSTGSTRSCSNCARSVRPPALCPLTGLPISTSGGLSGGTASTARRRASIVQVWRGGAYTGPTRGFKASVRVSIDEGQKGSADSKSGPAAAGGAGRGEPGRADKAKDRAAIGPFDLRAGLLFLATGAGLFVYFQREKAALASKRQEEVADARVGRPRIGGEFELVMPVGGAGKGPAVSHRFTHKDLEGSFSLIYFGFTNCPDICPEELDKMGVVVDRVAAEHGHIINPIFVSCDPARDNVAAVSTYVSDFHPLLVGLTGTYEQVKATCKAYRVYFSTPPSADPTSDYLVDHSIFFYLMDPEGRFVDAFGRAMDADDVTAKVLGFIKRWKDEGAPIETARIKERVAQDISRRVDSAKEA